MVSKIATFRLPENLIQEIRFRAEATGRDRTAVVIEALKQAFGMPISESRPATVEELHEQLNQLEQKFTALSEQLAGVNQKAHSGSRIVQVSSGLKQAMFPLETASANASEYSLPIADSFGSQDAYFSQINGLSEGRSLESQTINQELKFDIGEGKPDDAELQELAARIAQQARIFDQVLSASPDPICVIDRVGRFTYVKIGR